MNIRKGHKDIYSQTKVNKNLDFKNNYKIKYSEKSFKKIINKIWLIYYLSGNSNQETSKRYILWLGTF